MWKNDALGRTFHDTTFVRVVTKNPDGRETLNVRRVDVSKVEREYTIAGPYTRPLSREEIREAYPTFRARIPAA